MWDHEGGYLMRKAEASATLEASASNGKTLFSFGEQVHRNQL
jgi:hypothetical protein